MHLNDEFHVSLLLKISYLVCGRWRLLANILEAYTERTTRFILVIVALKQKNHKINRLDLLHLEKRKSYLSNNSKQVYVHGYYPPIYVALFFGFLVTVSMNCSLSSWGFWFTKLDVLYLKDEFHVSLLLKISYPRLRKVASSCKYSRSIYSNWCQTISLRNDIN